MQKLVVNEYQVNGEDVVEVEKNIILHFTAKTILLYEQMNPGRKFYKDQQALFTKVMKLSSLQSKVANVESAEDMDEESMDKIVNLMNDEAINKFIINVIPALYTEIHDGKFVQNEATYAAALESDWIVKLASITSLDIIMEELNSGLSASVVKKN